MAYLFRSPCLLAFTCLICGLAVPSPAAASYRAQRSLSGHDSQSPAASSKQHRKALTWLSTMPWSSMRTKSAFSNIMEHNFSIPRAQLAKGVVFTGSNHRLRKLMRDLLLDSDRPLKVGVVGGSISWGIGASVRGETDWFSLVSKWLIRTFPQTKVHTRNGCVPATPSSYMVMCLEMSVDPDVDLVFVEYVTNDSGYGNGIRNEGIYDNSKLMAYERLVRRILALPNKPAVVLMQIRVLRPPLNIGAEDDPIVPERDLFHHSLEDLYGTVAQYYDLQWLSFRNAVYRLTITNQDPAYKWEDIKVDKHHLADLGHAIAADLFIHLMQQTAISLALNPFGNQDVQLLGEPLPPPMHPGNLPPSSPMCLFQDALVPLVVSARGFNFVNEGTEEKPKKGYVAMTPGAVLQMALNTLRAEDPSGQISIHFAYLKGYVNMGKARIACVSGCTCEPLMIEAYHTEKVTQLYLAGLPVTQHERCIMSFTVLKETSSSGNKFKVAGVMLNDRPTTHTVGTYEYTGSMHHFSTHTGTVEQMRYASADAPPLPPLPGASTAKPPPPPPPTQAS